MSLTPLLLMTLACGFDSAVGLLDTASQEPAPTGDSSSPSDSDPPVDSDTPDPEDLDDDGDGYSENDGDCDDSDRGVHPGAHDACDGVDEDCDGQIDEDSASDDPYEPNDDNPTWLGALEDNDSHEIVATLHNDIDDDRYSFYVDDSWTWDEFPVTVTLSNIPSDATYKLTLNRLESDGGEKPVGEVDETFGTGTLTLVLEDETGPDDGGTYEIVVGAVANADCGRTYLLTVQGD